jgi:hypothetical protein
VPALVYAWIAFHSERAIGIIAQQFSLFSAAALIFLFALQFIVQTRHSRTHSTSVSSDAIATRQD